jgi:murein DD-endopeptidase MepM/ murein hydrolase activator NlpD
MGVNILPVLTPGKPGAKTRQAILTRLRSHFPEREFFMRANGQVRFVRISSALQMRFAGAIAAAFAVWLFMVLWMLISGLISSYDRAALLEREAAVASAESRVAKYRGGLGAVATDLAKRQDFIEKSVQGAIGPLPQDLPRGTVSDSRAEADKTVRKISMVLPEAAGLAQLEARQLVFVEQLTRYADARAMRAEAAMRRVGLNPAMMAAQDREAMGGPLIRLLTGPGDTIDPRFARLGASLARLSTMVQGLARVPNTLPASLQFISSGFGFRTDPFTGGGAFHAGLDFRGPIGTPVFAAAAGMVSFTGAKQGYGNCLEISHGNGLLTRYAHLSRIGVRMGQRVTAGSAIGGIGNTGRSTGPHLHFEVRIGDRAVDPRPFLEAPVLESKPHVFQEARAGGPRPGPSGSGE